MNSEQILLRHMARWGIQGPNPTKEQIVLAQPRTLTVKQVAERTGITPEYIRTTAHRNGFQFSESRTRVDVRSDWRPLKQIAATHGISESWACRLRASQ